jgi:hypothetical protein
MPISTSWYIPGRVILTKVTGAMTGEDIEEMNRIITENAPQSGMVHQLIDITEMTKAPTIGTLRQHTRKAGDGDGYVISIGKVNRLLEFVITTAAQFTNSRILVVPTLEEAIMKLRQLDPSV